MVIFSFLRLYVRWNVVTIKLNPVKQLIYINYEISFKVFFQLHYLYFLFFNILNKLHLQKCLAQEDGVIPKS